MKIAKFFENENFQVQQRGFKGRLYRVKKLIPTPSFAFIVYITVIRSTITTVS